MFEPEAEDIMHCINDKSLQALLHFYGNNILSFSGFALGYIEEQVEKSILSTSINRACKTSTPHAKVNNGSVSTLAMWLTMHPMVLRYYTYVLFI